MDEGAAVRDAGHALVSFKRTSTFSDSLEHNHDTPCNSPLLPSHKTASLARWRQFGDVNRNLGRTDADAEAVNDTADNEHANILRSTNDRRTNDPIRMSHAAVADAGLSGLPDDRSDHDRPLSSKPVRDVSRDQSTQPGASGHGGSDPSLHAGLGAHTLSDVGRSWTLVEVAFVLPSSDNRTHLP